MLGSYYDLFGVAPDADDATIRKRYVLLMRRYHPDVNRSPLANARAAELTEAYRALLDHDARSRHDAELAHRRQATVNARIAHIAHNQNRRALAVRRRSSRFRRGAARLTLLAVLLGTAVAAWQIQQRLVGRGAAPAALSPADTDGSSEAHAVVAALTVASAREARAMPPVSQAAVAGGVRAFRLAAAQGWPGAPRRVSENCHARLADNRTWDALDFCVALDQAAFSALASAGGDDGAYFADRHDRAEHLYITRLTDLDVIADRLEQIRGLVASVGHGPSRSPSEQMLHSVAKHGRAVASAVRDALYAGSGYDKPGAARDF